MAERDLYQVLGVAKGAGKDEIRKSYRRLARQHHPDVNPGNKDAAEKFKEISAAYEVLSDDARRKAYDEFGDVALRTGFDAEKARAYRQYQEQAQAGGGGFGGGDVDFDLGDLGDLFGFGGGGARRTGAAAGEDVVARVELDLAQALRGIELSVDAPSGQPCTTCSGSGTAGAACSACGGSGKVRAAQGPMRVVMPCRACGGNGRLPCPTCGGAGTASGTRKVTVRVPPGAESGSRLRVPGLGRPGVRGGPPGDLYIETIVRPHPHFRRDGLDLHLTLPVTLAEAWLGASVEVPTPDGTVALKVPPRSQTGQRLRLRGRGVKRESQTGDLFVELLVRLPDKDDPKFAEAVERAKSAYARPVREEIRL